MNPSTYYDLNPIAVFDQDEWSAHQLQVAALFRQTPIVYTPLMDWTAEAASTGARQTFKHDILQGDVNTNPIPFTANYINAMALNSRQRTMSYDRWGDKVQVHKSENIFTQWQKSGGKDWRPLLRGVLGLSVPRKIELLSRNAFVQLTPAGFATYANGAANMGALTGADTFQLEILRQWKLRVGQTGTPVIPGDTAMSRVAIAPPGVEFDIAEQISAAAGSDAELYTQATVYRNNALRYELATIWDTRIIIHPNDSYGRNNAVLYNAGAIEYQYGVVAPVYNGDGAPDPETTKVDGVHFVGQKDSAHLLELEDFGASEYEINDLVTIHTGRTSAYGVTNGCDFLDGKSIVRRVVAVDSDANTLSFDLPVMFDYTTPIAATSESGGAGTFYAFVTKARHIAMVVVQGGRGAFQADVAAPLEFHEPDPVDDFKSVWRFVWELHAGWNLVSPHVYEVHFCSVSLPKPGGIITP
jgi:hypothetical protein